jgi:hypothetical protein
VFHLYFEAEAEFFIHSGVGTVAGEILVLEAKPLIDLQADILGANAGI